MSLHALITGGTRGIGFAVAESLLANGYNVILTYSTDEQNALAVQQKLNQKFPQTNTDVLKADISNLQSIEVISDYLISQNIFLNALILNAGITDRSSFEEMEIENWKRVFDANVHFPVFLIQKLLPRFTEGASIVCTGSTMAVFPHSVSLAYGVTKSSVHSLVKNLVKFLSPLKIRINAVAPGFVDTEWQKTKPAEIKASINSKIALGRFCGPEELAEVYLMLVKNDYLNGEIISVDGGYSYK